MYRTTVFFRDKLDNYFEYQVGDTYPREGYEPDPARLDELSGSNNKAGKPVIELIMNLPEEPEEKPAKKTTRRKKK